MKAKRLVTIVLCMVLVAVLSVAGTLAYLTSTASVKNTFTMGQIEITMDEAKIDAYGEDQGTRTNEGNEDIILLPGHEYTKDPTIYVTANSEDSWLFVKVDNELAGIEDDANTIDKQITDVNRWTALPGVDGVYYQSYTKQTTNKTVKVFDSFTISSDADNTAIANHNDKSINVTAYAIQSADIDDVADAWDAVSGAYSEQNP